MPRLLGVGTLPRERASLDLTSSDLSAAVDAAIGAGAILRAAFGGAGDVDYKGPDQPVTQADRDADAFLRRALLTAAPGYGWISEESSPAAGSAATFWVVDPLDGTVNFVEGRPEFAVCVGLVRRGEPELGVVYNPMTDQLYTGVRGGGATLNGSPVRASTWRDPARLVVSWGEVERFNSPGLADWQVATVGSTALKLMRVAEGAADAYLSHSPKKIWDVCAAAVIAEAAGATVLDGFAKPLRYSADDLDVQGTMAYGRGEDTLLERLLSLGDLK